MKFNFFFFYRIHLQYLNVFIDLYCNFPEFQIIIICAHSRNIKDDYLCIHLSSLMTQTGLGVIVYINLCFIQTKIIKENKLYSMADIDQKKNS